MRREINERNQGAIGVQEVLWGEVVVHERDVAAVAERQCFEAQLSLAAGQVWEHVSLDDFGVVEGHCPFCSQVLRFGGVGVQRVAEVADCLKREVLGRTGEAFERGPIERGSRLIVVRHERDAILKLEPYRGWNSQRQPPAKSFEEPHLESHVVRHLASTRSSYDEVSVRRAVRALPDSRDVREGFRRQSAYFSSRNDVIHATEHDSRLRRWRLPLSSTL